MSTRRVSITLDKREFHTLEAIKVRYIFTDKYFPFEPEIKELLQGMLYMTMVTIAGNKNSLRSFINSLSSRKYAPVLTEAELSEETPEEAEAIDYDEDGSLYKAHDSSMPDQKSKSYIFTLESEDEHILKIIREMISQYVKIDVETIRDSDIIREALNFITGHRYRNINFFHYTYIGGMYGIPPAPAIKIFKPSDLMPFTIFEKERIAELSVDRPVFNRYRRKAKGKSFPLTVEELEKLTPLDATSKCGAGFNYSGAMFGFWIVSRTLPYNLTTYSLSAAIAMIGIFDDKHREQGEKSWEFINGLFFDLVDILLSVAESFNNDQ